MTILLIGLKGLSQPVITAKDVNPLVGDFYFYHIATNKMNAPDSGGANKIWDYSFLEDSLPNNAIQTKYFSPIELIGLKDFSKANLASISTTDTNNIYYYYISDTCNNMLDFYYDKRKTEERYSASSFLKYPLKYKSSYNWQYKTTVDKDYQVNSEGTVISDGYGTLILPDNVYKDVLRIKQVTKTKVQYMKDNTTSNGTFIVYIFLKKGIRHPLLGIINIDSKNWFANYSVIDK